MVLGRVAILLLACSSVLASSAHVVSLDEPMELGETLGRGRGRGRGRPRYGAGGAYALGGAPANRGGSDELELELELESELGESTQDSVDMTQKICSETGKCTKDDLRKLWNAAFHQGYLKRSCAGGGGGDPATLAALGKTGTGIDWGCGPEARYIPAWMLEDENAGCFLIPENPDGGGRENAKGISDLRNNSKAPGTKASIEEQRHLAEPGPGATRVNPMFYLAYCRKFRQSMAWGLYNMQNNIEHANGSKVGEFEKDICRMNSKKKKGRYEVNRKGSSGDGGYFSGSTPWNSVGQQTTCGYFASSDNWGPNWYRSMFSSADFYLPSITKGARRAKKKGSDREGPLVEPAESEAKLNFLTQVKKHLVGQCVSRDTLDTSGVITTDTVPGQCLTASGDCACHDGQETRILIKLKPARLLYTFFVSSQSAINVVYQKACFDAPLFACTKMRTGASKALKQFFRSKDQRRENLKTRSLRKCKKSNTAEVCDNGKKLKDVCFKKFLESTGEAKSVIPASSETAGGGRGRGSSARRKGSANRGGSDELELESELGETLKMKLKTKHKWGAIGKMAKKAKKMAGGVVKSAKKGAMGMVVKAIKRLIKTATPAKPKELRAMLIKWVKEFLGVGVKNPKRKKHRVYLLQRLKEFIYQDQIRNWVMQKIKKVGEAMNIDSIGMLTDTISEQKDKSLKGVLTSVSLWSSSVNFQQDWERPFIGLAGVFLNKLNIPTNFMNHMCSSTAQFTNDPLHQNKEGYESSMSMILAMNVENIKTISNSPAKTDRQKRKEGLKDMPFELVVVTGTPRFWRRAASYRIPGAMYAPPKGIKLKFNETFSYFGCIPLAYYYGEHTDMMQPVDLFSEKTRDEVRDADEHYKKHGTQMEQAKKPPQWGPFKHQFYARKTRDERDSGYKHDPKRLMQWGCPDAIPIPDKDGDLEWISSGTGEDMTLDMSRIAPNGELLADGSSCQGSNCEKEKVYKKGDIICKANVEKADKAKVKNCKDAGLGCVFKFMTKIKICDTCCCKDGLISTEITSSIVYGEKLDCAARFGGMDGGFRVMVAAIRNGLVVEKTNDVCFSKDSILRSNYEVCENLCTSKEKSYPSFGKGAIRKGWRFDGRQGAQMEPTGADKLCKEHKCSNSKITFGLQS